MPLYHIVISLEPYQQTYAYDTGNNLTNLSHQANGRRSAIITISKKIIIKPWVISIRLINFYYFVCAVVGYNPTSKPTPTTQATT
jgi:hypothetical protein